MSMETLKSSLNLWVLPPFYVSISPMGCPIGSASGLNQPSGFPAKTNPLTNVVSQTSPQSFHSNLDQTTQPKLAQPDFVLNPRVRKLRHAGPLLIDGLSFRHLHLRLER